MNNWNDFVQRMMEEDVAAMTTINIIVGLTTKMYNLGMTAEKLAEISDVPLKEIEGMVEGTVHPDYPTLCKLAYLLGMTITVQDSNYERFGDQHDD